MPGFVQSFDANNNCYVKIDVASGAIVGQQPRPFKDIDEVEPLEAEVLERAEQPDPLRAYR